MIEANGGSDARVERSAPVRRLGRLALKELREILRDQRTIITLVVMPLLLYPLLSLVFKRFLLTTDATAPSLDYIVVFRSEDEFRLFDWCQRWSHRGEPIDRLIEPRAKTDLGLSKEPTAEKIGDVIINPNLVEVVRGLHAHVGIRLASEVKPITPQSRDIEMDWEIVFLDDSYFGRKAASYLQHLFQSANQGVLGRQLKAMGLSQRVPPLLVKSVPIEDKTSEPAIPLATVIPLILILMTITGAVYPAIDLTAGERERGTLELLMAAPVPRLSLLAAKYIAVVTVAMMTALVNLVMMAATLHFGGMGAVLFGGGGLTVVVAGQVFAALLLLAAFYSALLLALASTARSFKEAQAYLIPLMLVSLAPGFLSLFPGTVLTPSLALVPLMNVVLLVRDLLSGNLVPLTTALVVATTVLYAAAAVALAAKTFGAENVLYATERTWSDMFRNTEGSRVAPSNSAALFCLAIIFPLLFFANGAINTSESRLEWKLVAGAAALFTIFGTVPLLAGQFGGLDLRAVFRIHRPSPAGLLSAAVLGLSLWPVCHEIVVGQQRFGIGLLEQNIVERSKEMVDQFRQVPLWLIILCLGLTPALAEEWFFRGYLLSALRYRTSTTRAVIVSALLFGAFHLVGSEIASSVRFLPSTFLGLVLAWLCCMTGSVWPGMLLHATHNSLLLTISHQQEALARMGIGAAETEHLPWHWLAASAVGIALGLGIAWFARRTSPGSSGRNVEVPVS